MSDRLENQPNNLTEKNNPLTVVGIGASAGGLSALEQLFDSLPSDSGATFVVIQHLAPDFKSLMKELLERHTNMAVYRVQEGMELQPNSIYLIPPGQNLVLESNVLRLEARKKNLHNKHELNFPIDIFFNSLAKNYGEKSIGVVLSGSGSDGSQGLRTIKEAGGVVLVQEPSTAEFDGMPKSAIATNIIDRVLPIVELAQLIHSCIISPPEISDDTLKSPGLLNVSTLKEIANILIDREKLDFFHYKPTTMSRRIYRRCLIHGLDEVKQYIELLRNDPEERKTLCDDLLIKVTRFFRDLEAWDNLENNVIPLIIEKAESHEELRFWVTACSTGEEAYSLAILLHEALIDTDKLLTIKIFATDIDKKAIETASTGIYPQSIVRNIAPERLQRYFVPKDNCYQVTRQLREMMIFSIHDLTKDAGFTRMNLVSCRNVLIYMQSDLQNRVLRNLHFALANQGTLFLGEAETLGEFESEFKSISKKWKIYQKIRDIRLPLPIRDNPRITRHDSLSNKFVPKTYVKESIKERTLKGVLQASNGIALAVDSNNRLLYVGGDAQSIFKAPDGEITNEITTMVIPSLKLPLNTALHRAKKEKKVISYEGIKLNTETTVSQISLQVIPPRLNAQDNIFIIQIKPQLETDVQIESSDRFESSSEAHRRIVELEQELEYTRENLQALVEELESTNEEQQASNEELTASNEELQSTNEELHSVNEELHTVNIEYQSKIHELTELNNDIDNLLQSTKIGVIFLDNHLRIRKFTPAVQEIIALRHSDLERPLEEISWKIECPQLLDLLQEVLVTEQTQELEVKHKQQELYFWMKINLYQTDSQENKGLVVSFVKIDEIKKIQLKLEEEIIAHQYTEEQLRVNQEYLLVTQQQVDNIFSSLEDAIWSIDLQEPRILYINSSFEKIYGRVKEEFFSNISLWLDVIHPADKNRVLAAHQKIGESGKTNIEYRIILPDGSIRWLRERSKLIYNDRTISIRQDFIISDITVQVQTQQALKDRERSFQAIFNSMFQFIGLLTPEGIILEANETALIFGGLTEAEVLNRPLWEAKWWTIEEETKQQLQDAIARAAQGEFIRYEVDLLGANEQVITVDFSLKPVINEQGEVVQLIPEGRDISELKRFREELEQANIELEKRVTERTQYLSVFSNRLKQLHRLGISEYEEIDDLFNDYLKAGCEMLNMNTGIVSQVQDSIYKILAIHSPLSLDVGYETPCQNTYCTEVVETQSTVAFSWAGTMEPMKTHPIYCNLKLESYIGTPILVNGNLYGTLNFSDTSPRNSEFTEREEDIVELMAKYIGNYISSIKAKETIRNREILFRNTFEQAAVGIAHVTLAGKFIQVNQRLSDILGYEKTEMLDLTLQDITHPDDLSIDTECTAKVLAREINSCAVEKRYIRHDGSIIWINLTTSLIQDNLGQPDYFVWVIEDISDRKKITNALEKNRIKLQKASQAKDAFIAHMSHELRTPLNSILGFSSILQKDSHLLPEQIHSLNIIHQSGQHLLNLINDILDVSKITAEKLQLEPRNFNLVECLKEISTLFSLRAQEKGLKFTTSISDSLPTTVETDETRLRQVLLNLLSNAIKFTQTGNITFQIHEIEPQQSTDTVNTQKIRFQVEDTGIGIPSDKFAAIFLPFEQSKNNNINQEGTGLGLTISQNIVQLMGGEIQVQSQFDQGSKFWFDLELKVEKSQQPYSSTKINHQALRRLSQTCKVLVVDDHDFNRALLLSYLEPLGFIVSEASNGDIGLNVAKTFQPDVILTDLIMPVMDGVEMIAQIKQESQLQNTVIIAVSANYESILKSSDIDCHDFLAKPVNLEKLLELLDNHLHLDWELLETQPDTIESNVVIAPVEEKLRELYELVKFGDIDGIEAWSNSLEAIDTQYIYFIEQVRHFTNNCQQEQLENFVQSFLK